MKEKILIKRGLLQDGGVIDKNAPYLATKLLNQFGVVVDKPELLSQSHLETIASFFGVNIPKSFYNNPQDTKHFTCEELLIEQLVSYFKISYVGTNSTNENDFDRVEIFKKVLPNYKDGDEMVLRTYKIISNIECNDFLYSLVDDFSKYTRPFSQDELNEFKWLYMNNFYCDQHINCKDNAISLFLEYKNINFAKMLDKKDVVKLSVQMKGELPNFTFDENEKTLLNVAISNAYDCPLTKKQAKYFNTIAKKVGAKITKEDNSDSPLRLCKELIKKDEVVNASKLLAKNGSLLERNLVWLLSRATPSESMEILELIKVKNPIVLFQLISGIINDEYSEPRTFTFTKNNKVKTHTETENEYRYRKSHLSIGTKNMLRKFVSNEISSYYKNLSPLGDIYLSDEFKNVAIPLNTSATGSGLDILPTGSRLPIKNDYIRAFCYWKNAFDIDTSVIFVHKTGRRDVAFWGNSNEKQYGESYLCSGDDRSANGSEYSDFKISELKELGYTHAIYTLNGFNSNLNSGEIYCGYQNKSDLDTIVWSGKNIEMKINVKGDSRAYMGFAIDFETNEIIVLNQMMSSDDRVVNASDMKIIKPVLNKDFLNEFNMYKILSYRGNLVNDPHLAKIVFDRDYIGNENQNVIKPTQIEKLVGFVN